VGSSVSRVTAFLKGRRKYILWSIALTLIFFAIFQYMSTHWGFAITRKDHTSLPYKYWIIKKGVMPERGEYIAFKSYRVPNFADGVRWVKVLSGVEGDKVETVKISEEERVKSPAKYVEVVRVNDMPVFLNIQGYVHLHIQGRNEPVTFRVLETDTKYRAMPIIESQVIPSGKYFVASPAQRSTDSRYWGLVDKKHVIGKAYPVW